jgi:hypothetical protein
MMVFYLSIGVSHAASFTSTHTSTQTEQMTEETQETQSSNPTQLIEQTKMLLRNLRETLKSEVGEDRNYDKVGYFPKFSSFQGLASQNKTEEAALNQVRTQLRDLLTRGNQDSMHSQFTDSDIKLLKTLHDAYGEAKYQGGLMKPCGLIATNPDVRQKAHAIIDQIIGLISQIHALKNTGIKHPKSTIEVKGWKISTKFLDDNLVGPAANKMLTKDEQIFLITKGYGLLDRIKTGDLRPTVSTELFSPEFLNSKSGWVSSVWKTTANVVKLGKGTIAQETLARRAYLEDIVAIVWALINESYLQEDFFQNGSFKIVDDNKLLYNFFVEYIKLAGNVDDLGKIAIANFNMASINKGAYFVYDRTRFSTHYKNETIHQTGIDIRFESTEYPLPVLPNNMTHLIVGLINFKNHEYIFLKPEDHGLGDWYNALIHGLGQVPGFTSAPKGFSEKIIPESLFIAFQDFFNSVPENDLLTLGTDGAEATKAIDSFTGSKKVPTSQELPISTMFNILQKELTKYNINLIDNVPEESQLYSLDRSGRILAEELGKFANANIRSGNEILLDINQISGGNITDLY